MKKYLLLSGIFLFFITPVLSEEVYLDLGIPEIHRYDTGNYKYESKKLEVDDEEENYLKPSFQTIREMFDEDFCLKKKSSTPKEKVLK